MLQVSKSTSSSNQTLNDQSPNSKQSAEYGSSAGKYVRKIPPPGCFEQDNNVVYSFDSNHFFTFAPLPKQEGIEFPQQYQPAALNSGHSYFKEQAIYIVHII